MGVYDIDRSGRKGVDEDKLNEFLSQPITPFVPPPPPPPEESGYIGGTLKSLVRGMAEIPIAAGNTLEWNEEAERTGDDSKRNFINRAGQVVSDTAERVRDFIPPAEPGSNRAKQAVFGGVESLPLSLAYAIPATVGAAAAGAAATPETFGAGTIPAALAGAAAGQAAVAPIMFRSTAQQTLEQLKKQLPDADPNALVDAAKKAGHKEWQGEAISDIPEALIFSRIPGLKAGADTAKAILKPGVKQFAKNVALSMPGEQVGEGYTSYGQAQAMNEVLPENLQQKPWEAVKDTVGPTAVMTLLMAGLGTGVQRYRANHVVNVLENANADPVERGKAAGTVYGLIKEANGEEAARNFLQHAYQAIGDEATTGTPPYAMNLEDPALMQPPNLPQNIPDEGPLPDERVFPTTPAFNPPAPSGPISRALSTTPEVVTPEVLNQPALPNVRQWIPPDVIDAEFTDLNAPRIEERKQIPWEGGGEQSRIPYQAKGATSDLPQMQEQNPAHPAQMPDVRDEEVTRPKGLREVIEARQREREGVIPDDQEEMRGQGEGGQVIPDHVARAVEEPREVPTSVGVATKQQTKETLNAKLSNGEVAPDSPIRLTTVEELNDILNTGKLREGRDFEGRSGISAQVVDGKKPIVAYGPNDRISAAIVFPKEAARGKGESANEVKVDANTDPKSLRFVIDGHPELLTYEQLQEAIGGKVDSQQREAETEKAEVGKEPWEMTREEFVKTLGMDEKFIPPQPKREAARIVKREDGSVWQTGEHGKAVYEALIKGKPVPPEVLAEYPDLAPKRKGVRAEESPKPNADAARFAETRRKNLEKRLAIARNTRERESIRAKLEKLKKVDKAAEQEKKSPEPQNAIFTEDAYQKARARMKAKLSQLNAGFDPELLQDGITIAGYHLERGARKFADYTKAMVDEFGDAIRPYLKAFYNGVRDLPGIEWTSEMDDYQTVQDASVEKSEARPLDEIKEEYAEVRTAWERDKSSPQHLSDRMTELRREAWDGYKIEEGELIEYAHEYGAKSDDIPALKKRIADVEKKLEKLRYHATTRAQATTREARASWLAVELDSLTRQLRKAEEAQQKRDLAPTESTKIPVIDSGKGKPNTVYRDMYGLYDGAHLGLIEEPYDGTLEGLMGAYEKIQNRFNDFNNASNMESPVAATDENGRAKYRLSPNGRFIYDLQNGDEINTDAFKDKKLGASSPNGKPAQKSPERELYDRATEAHAHVSMNPAAAAKVWRDGMVSAAEELRESLEKIAKSDRQKEAIAAQINLFKQGYVEHARPILSAISRQVSSMVAGKSQFSKNHDKRNSGAQSAEQKANDAFTKWQKEAKEYARQAILNARTPEEVEADEQAAANETKRVATAKHNKELSIVKQWMALKPGDMVDVGGNGKVAIAKKNRKSIETEGGAKWTITELLGIESKKADELMAEAEAEIVSDTPFTLASHDSLFKRLRDGEPVTVDEVKKGFDSLVEGEEAIKAELQAMKKDDLLKRMGRFSAGRYKNEKKDVIVSAIYRGMVTDFAYLDGSNSLSYGMRDKVSDVVRKRVEKLTEEGLKKYAEAVAKERDDYKTRMEGYVKAIKDPETWEEFQKYRELGYKIEDLPPEKLKLYDELKAKHNREQRAREAEKKATVSQVKTDVEMTLKETTHTKKGTPLFVVQLSDRVERDVYNGLNAAAKKLGGYYSSFRGAGAVPGFQFKTREDAEKFMAIREGDVSRADKLEEKAEERQEKKVSKLRAVAESLKEKAEEQLSRDRLTNTAKRARQASGAEESARSDIQLAETMLNLADAIESGEATHLDGVAAKTHVETLKGLLRSAKYAYEKAKDIPYVDSKNRTVTEDDVDFAKYPYPAQHESHIRDLATFLKDKKGAAMDAAWLSKMAKERTHDSIVSFIQPGDIERLESILAKTKRFVKDSSAKSAIENIADRMQDYNRLQRMGIPDLPSLRAALREFLKFRAGRREAGKAKQLERDLVGKKVGVDFFPTPPELAGRMVEMAGVEPGMRVLEPSAGNGNIAEAIRDAGAEPDVAEISPSLREVLEAKGFSVVGQDFMDVDGEYDAIIMNPPFSNNQDIEHVRHAFDLLKPGGKLVAIMGEGAFFRGGKTENAFREWIDEQGADVEKLPEGTFTDKRLLNTTGVNARLVVVKKEGVAEKPEASDSKIIAALKEVVSRIGTITKTSEAQQLDDDISKISDEIKRFNSTLAYRLMKKGEEGAYAATKLNTAEKITEHSHVVEKQRVADLRTAIDDAIKLLEKEDAENDRIRKEWEEPSYPSVKDLRIDELKKELNELTAEIIVEKDKLARAKYHDGPVDGIKEQLNKWVVRQNELNDEIDQREAEERKAETPAWHTDMPEQGIPVEDTDKDKYNGGYAPLINKVIDDAIDAVKQNQWMSGEPLYARLLSAKGVFNGRLRLVPADQATPGWEYLSQEPFHINAITRDQLKEKLRGLLRSAPIIGDKDAAADTPAEVEAIANNGLQDEVVSDAPVSSVGALSKEDVADILRKESIKLVEVKGVLSDDLRRIAKASGQEIAFYSPLRDRERGGDKEEAGRGMGSGGHTNGFVVNDAGARVVFLNTDSKSPLGFVLAHELTHRPQYEREEDYRLLAGRLASAAEKKETFTRATPKLGSQERNELEREKRNLQTQISMVNKELDDLAKSRRRSKRRDKIDEILNKQAAQKDRLAELTKRLKPLEETDSKASFEDIAETARDEVARQAAAMLSRGENPTEYLTKALGELVKPFVEATDLPEIEGWTAQVVKSKATYYQTPFALGSPAVDMKTEMGQTVATFVKDAVSILGNLNGEAAQYRKRAEEIIKDSKTIAPDTIRELTALYHEIEQEQAKDKAEQDAKIHEVYDREPVEYIIAAMKPLLSKEDIKTTEDVIKAFKDGLLSYETGKGSTTTYDELPDKEKADASLAGLLDKNAKVSVLKDRVTLTVKGDPLTAEQKKENKEKAERLTEQAEQYRKESDSLEENGYTDEQLEAYEIKDAAEAKKRLDNQVMNLRSTADRNMAEAEELLTAKNKDVKHTFWFNANPLEQGAKAGGTALFWNYGNDVEQYRNARDAMKKLASLDKTFAENPVLAVVNKGTIENPDFKIEYHNGTFHLSMNPIAFALEHHNKTTPLSTVLSSGMEPYLKDGDTIRLSHGYIQNRSEEVFLVPAETMTSEKGKVFFSYRIDSADIHVNPGRSELVKMIQGSRFKELRVVKDPATGDIYVADAGSTYHKFIAQRAGLDWSKIDGKPEYMFTVGQGDFARAINPNGQRYSIAVERQAGIEKTAIEKAIAPLLKKWKNAPEVKVVQSESELPENLKAEMASIAAQGEIDGVFDGGVVYLIADNMPNARDAVRVLLHEAVGHYGVRGLLGKRFDTVLLDVFYVYGKDGLQEIADRYGLDLNEFEDRMIACEEKLAEIAESGEKPGLVKRAIAAIREWLRSIGVNVFLTDNDIRSMIAKAAGWVEGGDSIESRGNAKTFNKEVAYFSDMAALESENEAPLLHSEGVERDTYPGTDEAGKGVQAGILEGEEAAAGIVNPRHPQYFHSRFHIRQSFSTAAALDHLRSIDPKAALGGLKDFINPLDWSRYAKGVSEMTPQSVQEAVGYFFANPVFQAERDPDKQPFVRSGLEREQNKVDLLLKMFGWDGSKEKAPKLMERLTRTFTRWQNDDITTSWGRIMDSFQRLSAKDRKGVDWLLYRGDVDGVSYKTYDMVKDSAKVAKRLPSEAAFNTYRQIRDHIDTVVAQVVEDQTRKFMFEAGLPEEEIEKHITDYRNQLNRMPGWMPRSHGEGDWQVNVYHHITRLKWQVSGGRAFLPFFPSQAVADEIEKLATAHGLKYRHLRNGRQLVEVDEKAREKLKKEIRKLKESLEKGAGEMYASTREEIEAKIANAERKLVLAQSPPSEQIRRFTNASTGIIGDISTRNALTKRELEAQLEQAREDGESAAEIKRLENEIEKIGDGRIKVKVYMRLQRTERQAGKHVKEVQATLKKHMPENYLDGEYYEVSSKFSDTISEGMYGDMKNDFAMEQAQLKAIEWAANHGEISKEKAASLRHGILQTTAEVLMARGAGSHRIRRANYLIEGYDAENVTDQYHDYMTGTAGMLSKAMYAKEQFENFRYSNPKVKRWAERYIKDNLRNMGFADSVSGNLRSVAAFMYLGFKVSSMLINATQVYTMGIAELGRHTKRSALKLITAAQKDIVTDSLTAEERELFHSSIWKIQEQETAVNEMSGSREGITGKVSRFMHTLTDKALMPFQEVEMLNRKTMILSSYRAFLADGMRKQDAIDRALEVNRAVNFEMSRANLPGFARNPVGRTIYALQSFAWNNWNWVYNRLTSGEKRDMVALLKYAGTLAVIGGAAALPGGDELDKLLRRLTGRSIKMDLQKWTREHAHRYGTAGDMLNDFVWHGTGSAVGVNISNALRLQVPFVSPWLQGETLPESSMGVFAGLYQKGANAGRALSKGDAYRGAESLAPEFISGPMRAYRQFTEGATTMGGKPVFDENGKPIRYSLSDVALRTAGFQPLKQSERTEAAQQGKVLSQHWNEERQDLIDAYRIADKDGRRGVMQKVMRFNADLRESQAAGLVLPIKLSTLQRAVQPKPDRKKAGWLRKTIG